MALKSTIYKAALDVADIDAGYYAHHPLTLACHPSETAERMMVRLLAFALNAHQIESLCQGDATLGFGAGLSDPDDPDLSLTDFTGRRRVWIEVGQPDERPLVRACSKADQVRVYAYSAASDVWWTSISGKIARMARLEVWQLFADSTRQLADLASRSMSLQATIQDGALIMADSSNSVVIEPVRLL